MHILTKWSAWGRTSDGTPVGSRVVMRRIIGGAVGRFRNNRGGGGARKIERTSKGGIMCSG